MDQLIGNVVNVTQGSTTLQFAKLLDGTYNAPLANAGSLTLSSGAYTYTTKQGVVLTFNTSGNVSTWHSPDGPTVTYTYSGSNLASVGNGMGRTLTFTYDGSNRITYVENGASGVTTYAYNSNSELTTYTDAASKATNYEYASGKPGLMTVIKYPSFSTTAFVTNTYDTLDRVQTQRNANYSGTNDTTFTYYFAGYRSEEVDPDGNSHVQYNNSRGKVAVDVDHLGKVTTNTYDGYDRTVTTTLPEGNSVGYTYDAKSNVLTAVATPKSGSGLSTATQTYTYNSTWNKVATATDPLSRVMTYTYDGTTGTLTSVVADYGSSPHLNATTSYTYNSRGQVLTVTDPVGTVTQYNYDTSTEKLTSVVADYGSSPHLNLTTSLAYDLTGNVSQKTDPKSHATAYTYDWMRRLITVTAPSPFTALARWLTYDEDGRLTKEVSKDTGTGGIWQQTSFTYSPSGKRLTAVDPDGHTTTYAYDKLDRVSSITDAASRVTSLTYDAESRPYQVFNTAIQSGALEKHEYTDNGKEFRFTDARSNQTTYTYDGFDRLITTTYPNSSTQSATYNAVGTVATRTNRAGNRTDFTYDALNRPTAKTPYNYTAPTVTYTYDLAGRLTGVSDNSTSITSVANPTGTSGIAFTTDYTYDNLDRRTGITWDHVNSQTTPTYATVTFGHAYNNVNQRSYQSVTDDTWWLYPYNSAYTTSYTANNMNQYTAVGSASSMTYDTKGNLTYDSTAFTYAYDAENRMTSIVSGGSTLSSHAYDARGWRKSKTASSATTIYVTDADNRELLEYDSSTGQIPQALRLRQRHRRGIEPGRAFRCARHVDSRYPGFGRRLARLGHRRDDQNQIQILR